MGIFGIVVFSPIVHHCVDFANKHASDEPARFLLGVAVRKQPIKRLASFWWTAQPELVIENLEDRRAGDVRVVAHSNITE